MTGGRAAERYAALIRAINVSGHHTLNMQAVRAAFAAPGCANVPRCMQSGNIIFEVSQQLYRGFPRCAATTRKRSTVMKMVTFVRAAEIIEE